MKIDKTNQKVLMKLIFDQAKSKGFAHAGNTLYKREGTNFIVLDLTIVASCKMVYRLSVKEYGFDDLLWEIMMLSENKSAKDSLRANGAFASPAVTLEFGQIELEEDFHAFATSLLQKTEASYQEFPGKEDICTYILANENIVNDPILTCLSLVQAGQKEKAIFYAKELINQGKESSLSSGGKDFLAWMLMYH